MAKSNNSIGTIEFDVMYHDMAQRPNKYSSFFDAFASTKLPSIFHRRLLGRQVKSVIYAVKKVRFVILRRHSLAPENDFWCVVKIGGLIFLLKEASLPPSLASLFAWS